MPGCLCARQTCYNNTVYYGNTSCRAASHRFTQNEKKQCFLWASAAASELYSFFFKVKAGYISLHPCHGFLRVCFFCVCLHHRVWAACVITPHAGGLRGRGGINAVGYEERSERKEEKEGGGWSISQQQGGVIPTSCSACTNREDCGSEWRGWRGMGEKTRNRKEKERGWC